MTIAELLSKPEFWSALFGALAAFLLGVLATWWTSIRAKRTAGNLALMALAQMYELLESARLYFLIDEPNRVRAQFGHDPVTFHLRGLIGFPRELPTVSPESLGFLVDSHDPDVIARILSVERSFISVIEVIRRHEQRHGQLQLAINAAEPTGRLPMTLEQLVGTIGAQPFVEIDNTVVELQKIIPETSEGVFRVMGQLRAALRYQFPLFGFIRVAPSGRRTLGALPPNTEKPATWRRILRWLADLFFKPRHFRRRIIPESPPAPVYPNVQRFPRN
jgi:hypothetical protein